MTQMSEDDSEDITRKPTPSLTPRGSYSTAQGNALVVLHIFLRPGACPLEIHARFYIRRLPILPAFVRVASQAAFGSLRGDTDDGGWGGHLM